MSSCGIYSAVSRWEELEGTSHDGGEEERGTTSRDGGEEERGTTSRDGGEEERGNVSEVSKSKTHP